MYHCFIEISSTCSSFFVMNTSSCTCILCNLTSTLKYPSEAIAAPTLPFPISWSPPPLVWFGQLKFMHIRERLLLSLPWDLDRQLYSHQCLATPHVHTRNRMCHTTYDLLVASIAPKRPKPPRNNEEARKKIFIYCASKRGNLFARLS